MPKAKPDSLQSIRFELQEHEREALGMVAASTAFRNVGQGVGAILDPILDNLVSILGFIIAKEGIEWVLEAFDRAEQRNQEEIAAVQTSLYEDYVSEYNSLYGPGGSAVTGVTIDHRGNVKKVGGETYDDYLAAYNEKYGKGTPEYIRLGRLNLPPVMSRDEWEATRAEARAEVPPLLSESEFIDSLNEDEAHWYNLLNPLTSINNEKSYQKAMWWQKWVGRPLRSAGSNISGSLKFW
jgi:hypothetical protein